MDVFAESRAEMERILATRPERCPICGGEDLRYIIWGLPIDPRLTVGEDWEERVAIGGCLLPPDGPPEWRCVVCGTDFSLSSPQAQ